MGRKAEAITLTTEEREYLELQTRSRTIQAQTVGRARILLLRADATPIDEIADKVGINRCSVLLCLKKFKEGGVENALFDAPGRGRNAEITDDEKAWIINIACQKPVNLGYAAEVWTRALLTKHINKYAEQAGHLRLSTISQSKVRTILEDADIKPNKITYYCENRDPDFENKMHNVLLVYKQLSMQFDEDGKLMPFSEDGQVVHVLSYDEKPGIQAIATTSDDLAPDDKHKTISRDYEYKRLGTVSLLAGIDLQTGEAIPLVKESHNSKDYIEFLKLLDMKYPKGDKIRLVLDNLKVHSSEETRKYLATIPGRFEFVFTPKHGSWLNPLTSRNSSTQTAFSDSTVTQPTVFFRLLPLRFIGLGVLSSFISDSKKAIASSSVLLLFINAAISVSFSIADIFSLNAFSSSQAAL